MATRYFVSGKGVPRSVCFENKRSAISYQNYYSEKGKKSRIYKTTKEKCRSRFLERGKKWKTKKF